jgi:hypothetical protein
MRFVVLMAVAVAGLATLAPATAQQNPAMDNPSVAQPKNDSADNNAALSPGANSFAEGQARSLLESRGFAQVSALMNDSQGIWRGTAMNGSTRVRVSVDYKGNISAQPE